MFALYAIVGIAVLRSRGQSIPKVTGDYEGTRMKFQQESANATGIFPIWNELPLGKSEWGRSGYSGLAALRELAFMATTFSAFSSRLWAWGR